VTKAKGLQGCGPKESPGIKAKRPKGCGPTISPGQEEAQESHHILLRVLESVRE